MSLGVETKVECTDRMHTSKVVREKNFQSKTKNIKVDTYRKQRFTFVETVRCATVVDGLHEGGEVMQPRERPQGVLRSTSH